MTFRGRAPRKIELACDVTNSQSIVPVTAQHTRYCHTTLRGIIINVKECYIVRYAKRESGRERELPETPRPGERKQKTKTKKYKNKGGKKRGGGGGGNSYTQKMPPGKAEWQ